MNASEIIKETSQYTLASIPRIKMTISQCYTNCYFLCPKKALLASSDC